MPNPEFKKSYKKQGGCYNCRHAFKYWDYEQGNDYYCCHNAIRPPCDSCGMQEIRTWDKEGRRKRDVWEKWSKNRAVDAYGRCDFYEQKEEVSG